jgi:lipopolysaccharide export system permease protein
MVILEKHVLKSYVTSFIFCITLLIVIGIIGDILGFIDEIFKNSIPLKSILAFYFYLAPFAFVNMVPFACLLAAVYVFNSLSKNHEVTAVIASGLSLWRLLRPVLMVTLLFCLFTFLVNDRFVPSTMEKSNMIRQEKLETGSSDDKKRSGMRDMAVYGKGGQIIFAKSFNVGDKALTNVIIHEEDVSHNVIEKISARKIRWEGEDGWVGQDVIVFKVDDQGKFMGDPEVYKTKKISIEETPEDFRKAQTDPRFMSYVQLREYLKLLKTGSKDTLRRLNVDLNYKLAFPFTALITVLIGVPFSIETGRANALIGMARGITVAIAYLPVVAITLALGKGGYIPPFLSAWLGIILFALAGIYFVNKKS